MAEQTKNLMQEHDGIFDVIPGAGITSVVAEAIERSKRERRPIIFSFSDVPVTITSKSDPEIVRADMFSAWEQLHSGS